MFEAARWRARVIPLVGFVSALALVLVVATSFARSAGVGFTTDAAFCITRKLAYAIGSDAVRIVFGACIALYAVSIGCSAAIAQRLAMRAQLGRGGAMLAAVVAAGGVLGVPWFLATSLSGLGGAVGAAVLALVIGVGGGVASIAVPRGAAGRALVAVVVLVGMGVLAWRAVPRYQAAARAHGVERARVQVHAAKLGRYLHAALPAARVVAAEACTVAAYAERSVSAIDAGSATNAAERFEWLEGQGASETRPTHVAAPADWFGVADVVGALVTDGWFGRTQVVLAAIDWDHVGTGERPLAVREGWSVVDRIDVADTASERAHAWTAAATAALVGRDVTRGLVLDGGRTIDAGDATFTIARTPGLLAQLVLRTGGPARGEPRDVIRGRAQLTIEVDGKVAGTIDVPAPAGAFVELGVTLPGGPAARDTARIRVRASAPYRAYHWFVVTP